MTASLIANHNHQAVVLAARVSGIAIAASGLGLAMRLAGDALGDAGILWNGLAIFLGPAIVGGLIVLVGDAPADYNLRSPIWQKVVGTLALVAVLALALRAADARMVQAGGEVGIWGFMRVVSIWAPLALLLLLSNPRLIFPTRPLSVFGVLAGTLAIVVAVLIGIHAASQAPAWKFWTFLGSLVTPGAMGLLLVTASLDRLPLRLPARSGTLAMAGLLIVGVVAHSLWLADRVPHNGSWIAVGNVASRLTFALLIVLVARSIPTVVGIATAIGINVALYAHAVWLTSNMDDPDEPVWILLLITTSSVAFAVLAILLCLQRRAFRSPSSRLEVPRM
jgi:hypothetical protein